MHSKIFFPIPSYICQSQREGWRTFFHLYKTFVLPRAEMTKFTVAPGLHGKPQTQRSVELAFSLSVSASNLFPVHGQFMADQPMLVRTFVAEPKQVSKKCHSTASITDEHFHAYETSSSVLLSKPRVSLPLQDARAWSNQGKLFSHYTTLCYTPLLEYQRRHPPLSHFCCSARALLKL